VADCNCRTGTDVQKTSSGLIYISRERKGRGGKEVSVIKQLHLNQSGLKMLASKLKNRCGTGGTVSGRNIEIQGDHREKLKTLLESEGYQVKLSGG
jgi:translation initiation factor 1